MQPNYESIVYRFINKNEKIESVEPFGNGHINCTFLVTTDKNKYTLQKINTTIFKDVEGLMNNITRVTSHIAKKSREMGKDPRKTTLTFLNANADNKKYVFDEDGTAYRMSFFVPDTFTIEQMENPHHFYLSGVAFGEFAKMLMDFDASVLVETIPFFHDTVHRFGDFEKAVSDNLAGKADSVSEEIEFVRARRDFMSLFVDQLKDGRLPLRVTHNDTKLNNVLFDEKTQKPAAVIDLDTVMPGSYLFDFGDAIRSGATHAAEDEPDLSKVDFDLDLFKQFAKGYIETSKDSLTENEIKMFPYAGIMLTLECGMRFLTDHLNGDVYFHVKRENHNLDRARTQFCLVKQMEQNIEKLKEIINELVK